jgi:hypothetical protein
MYLVGVIDKVGNPEYSTCGEGYEEKEISFV